MVWTMTLENQTGSTNKNESSSIMCMLLLLLNCTKRSNNWPVLQCWPACCCLLIAHAQPQHIDLFLSNKYQWTNTQNCWTWTVSDLEIAKIYTVREIRHKKLCQIPWRSSKPNALKSLWPPCVADADIIFLPFGFFLSFFLNFVSPNLIGRILDVYHTLTHDVALVRF